MKSGVFERAVSKVRHWRSRCSFGLFARRDVSYGAKHSSWRPLFIPEYLGRRRNPMYFSVGMNCSKLDVIGSIVLQCIANGCVYSLAVLPMNQRRKILHGASKLAAFDTVDVIDEIGPFDPVFDNIPIPDSDFSGIEREFQTVFAALDCFLGFSTVGYIAKNQHDSEEALLFIANGRRAVLDRNIAAILTNENRYGSQGRTKTPSRIAFSTGLSAGNPVLSLRITKTSEIVFPAASD